MISTRFEDVVMTMFNQDYENVKHFLIDESTLDEKQSEAVAKRFCKKHKMLFKSIVLHKPYKIHTWQHEAVYGFDAECLPGCLFKR